MNSGESLPGKAGRSATAELGAQSDPVRQKIISVDSNGTIIRLAGQWLTGDPAVAERPALLFGKEHGK